MVRAVTLALACAAAVAAVGAGVLWTGGGPTADQTAPPDATPTADAPAPPDAPRAPPADGRRHERRPNRADIAWRTSTAVGTPDAGRLLNGVLLPNEGVHFVTWDPVRWRLAGPPGRRYGTDRLLRVLLAVARAHRRANPGAPRMTVGDLSRPGGGDFSAPPTRSEFGPRPAVGHVSHQNGRDADIYYPRRDGREGAPDSPADVDLRLAQDLVDRFVAAGAQFVFIGPGTGLAGPPGVVQVLARHDGHLHVRLAPG